MLQLRIDTNELVKYTNKLEKLHKSALPVAVRNTLDSAAFDVKKNTMPLLALKEFEQRQKNFFKANSRVKKSAGFAIDAMVATVGFIPPGGNNHAVQDLEQQERGGTIGGRSFIPLKPARVGRSWSRNVRRNVRITQISNRIVDSKDSKGKNKAEQFTRAALHAGKDGYVIGNKTNGRGNKILFDVRSVKRKGRGTVIKTMPLFAVKANRGVRVSATHFMRRASEMSAHKMEMFYKKHAEKQVKKYGG